MTGRGTEELRGALPGVFKGPRDAAQPGLALPFGADAAATAIALRVSADPGRASTAFGLPPEVPAAGWGSLLGEASASLGAKRGGPAAGVAQAPLWVGAAGVLEALGTLRADFGCEDAVEGVGLLGKISASATRCEGPRPYDAEKVGAAGVLETLGALNADFGREDAAEEGLGRLAASLGGSAERRGGFRKMIIRAGEVGVLEARVIFSMDFGDGEAVG